MRVAVVTARGGSKRIPRKNVRDFLGRPLIAWTIGNLLSSHLFDVVCVSTDDDEIAKISSDCGAVIPYMRDRQLADDFTGTNEVVVDFIQRFESTEGTISELCVSYPAAVGFGPNHLIRSHERFSQEEFDLLFSAVRFPAPIERAWHRSANGEVQMRNPEFLQTRSQDLEESFYDAGQVYWWRKGLSELLRSGGRIRRGIYEVSRSDAVDIDTEDDWRFAEDLFRARLNT